MDIVINSDEMLQKIFDKMIENTVNAAKSQGLDEEEVNATIILNKKRIIQEATNVDGFIKAVFAPELLEKSEESNTAESQITE